MKNSDPKKEVEFVERKAEDGGVTTSYKCDQCSKEYPKRWQAAKHMKKCGRKSGKHVRFDNDAIQSCLVCKLVVHKNDELKQHLFDFHNEALIFAKYSTSFDKLIGVK